MSFFKNLFSKGEPKGDPFIATPTQSIPGLEPIVVQAIENLYPDEEDQKLCLLPCGLHSRRHRDHHGLERRQPCRT